MLNQRGQDRVDKTIKFVNKNSLLARNFLLQLFRNIFLLHLPFLRPHSGNISWLISVNFNFESVLIKFVSHSFLMHFPFEYKWGGASTEIFTNIVFNGCSYPSRPTIECTIVVLLLKNHIFVSVTRLMNFYSELCNEMQQFMIIRTSYLSFTPHSSIFSPFSLWIKTIDLNSFLITKSYFSYFR